mgnify:CR=1 FL=1
MLVMGVGKVVLGCNGVKWSQKGERQRRGQVEK